MALAGDILGIELSKILDPQEGRPYIAFFNCMSQT
jgi:hypothetical protein